MVGGWVAHVILVSALGPNPSFFLFWGTFIQLGGLLGQGPGLGLGPGLDNNSLWTIFGFYPSLRVGVVGGQWLSYCNSILVGELTLRANGVPASGSTDQSQLSMRVTVMGGWERPLDTIYRQSSLMPRSQLIDNSLENPTLSLLSQAHSMVRFFVSTIHVYCQWTNL